MRLHSIRRSRLGVLVSAVTLTGCATIMHGTSQSFGVSSSPTAATVTIDGLEKGKTPVIADLSRKKHHIIKITANGYAPFEATVTRKTSGWVWGNIVFGGLIGLAVDAITGGLYVLTPEQVAGQLAKETGARATSAAGVYVVLVPHADARWTQIGMLARD